MTTFSRKTLVSALGALTLATALATPFAAAEAGWRHRHYGYRGAVAAGIVGGLALGALAASAAPAYAEPVYVEPTCYFVKRRIVDVYGNVYIRRERVC